MIDANTKVVYAAFINDQKTLVRIWTINSKTDEKVNFDIDSNIDKFLWNQVLQQVTVDEIAEMTEQYVIGQRRMVSARLGEYAKANGLIYEPGSWQPTDKLLIDHIFALPEGQLGDDFLFEVKLRAFDIPAVADSTNQEYKTKMRDAETPIDVLYWAGKIIHE